MTICSKAHFSEKKTKYGHGNTRHRETKSDITPPLNRRLTTSNGEGGGRSGGLKGHGDRAGGLQGGARSRTNGGAGISDPETRAAIPDPGTRAAMADPEIRGAMTEQGTPWAMVGNNLHMDSTYLQTAQKTMCKIQIQMEYRWNLSRWLNKNIWTLYLKISST